MSILGLAPHNHIALIEPHGPYEPITAEQFVERLHLRVEEMEQTLGENEQLEVVAFLPSGKAVFITHVQYENPAVVILNGEEQDTRKKCTLLAHQSSVQMLVSVEPLPTGCSRKKLRFTQEK